MPALLLQAMIPEVFLNCMILLEIILSNKFGCEKKNGLCFTEKYINLCDADLFFGCNNPSNTPRYAMTASNSSGCTGANKVRPPALRA